jgi:hypothetical protein
MQATIAAHDTPLPVHPPVGLDTRSNANLQAAITVRQDSLWPVLLTHMAASPTREDAGQRLVANLAEKLPDHTIRFGWGTLTDDPEAARERHLTRLLDSRLGWLGADNSIYETLKNRFEKPSPDGKDKTVFWEAGNLVLELIPQSSEQVDPGVAKSHARVWIRPPQDADETLQRFSRDIAAEVLVTIATVFFSRPVIGQFDRIHKLLTRWWSKRGTLGIAVLVLVLIMFIPASYRIEATATVTAMDSRRVAAPISATLLVAHVRPGDTVTKDQPLFELDGAPLRIELEAISSEIAETTKDEDIALASGQIAQAQLAGLKRKTLSRRRELITSRLDQLVVTSPMDGIVIVGDLQHSLGTPLDIGQTLLEIAPSGSIEIELEIPEVEIGFVNDQNPVEFWFPAVSGETFSSHVNTVWPAATIREDQNVFVAKTPLPSANATLLRVGMQGQAVVMGPTRPWIWKWVRLPLRQLGWVIGW